MFTNNPPSSIMRLNGFPRASGDRPSRVCRFESRGKAATAKKTAGKKREKVAVKYDDGKGNTWTGRGMAPRWFAAAEKSGKKREPFAVLS